MKQVFLSGAGEISVLDVPLPGAMNNSILVRNVCSLISTGTEGAAVASRPGLMGVIEKASKSRSKVEQVWRMAQTEGLSSTLEKVRDKLSELSMIGYSCAGQVVETCGDTDFAPGDMVACMGVGFANHAEYVVVPNNLAVKIPDGVDCREAAFGSLACIAQQGLRVLELPPGECVVVIGLGLIGALAAQQARAMGYRTFGADISAERAGYIAETCGIETFVIGETDIPTAVKSVTGGHGADAVVVCAATKSDDPVDLAFDICRRKGKVSIVGDVGLGLKRAKMYRKELSLLMSTSYGPGRYDDSYEVDGIDYPYAYVRWTERRNLEFFLSGLAAGTVSASPFISAQYPVAKAVDAYAAAKSGGGKSYGVLLQHGSVQADAKSPDRSMYVLDNRTETRIKNDGRIGIGLIGCGGFAKAVHLPNLKALNDQFRLTGVSTRSGGTAGAIAKKHGIPLATSDMKALLDDDGIDAVIISTRHASHGEQVLAALEAGKHVFVEKPMCLDVDQGRAIEMLATEKGLVVRVGFNRRFAPILQRMKKAVGTGGERIFTCRVNIGALPADHWSNTPAEGGRFLGEGCHFLDLCNWFFDSAPETISASYVGRPSMTNPNLSLSIGYPGGGVGHILYTTLGNTGMGKEYYEAFGNGVSVQSGDYANLLINGKSQNLSKREKGDKGQRAELAEFAAAIRGEEFPMPGASAKAGWLATWMALMAVEGAREGSARQPQLQKEDASRSSS